MTAISRRGFLLGTAAVGVIAAVPIARVLSPQLCMPAGIKFIAPDTIYFSPGVYPLADLDRAIKYVNSLGVQEPLNTRGASARDTFLT